MRSNPHGHLDTTHIFFPVGLLNQYLELLRLPIFEHLFPLAKALSDVNCSDAQVAQLIPETWPADFKYALQSQLSRLRAVAKYRHQVNQPLPPARSIKCYFVHEYNLTRG